jgi:acetyl esterase
MTLHPQCAAFLAEAAKANLPDISVMGARRARAEGHTPRDFSGPLREDVAISTRYITTLTADVVVNIYQPPGNGPFNGMVYFHGGGWVLNYVNKYDAQLQEMAVLTNSVIVSVNYQKAPEHKFPIPFDDCYEAFLWFSERATEFNVNPAKIGIGGDSAGGNLASGVAHKIRDVNTHELAYQLLIYPCNGVNFETSSYLANAEGYGLTRNGMRWLWEQYLNGSADNSNPYAVPLNAKNFDNLAPAVLITAEFDVLHDDGTAYVEKLQSAGVEVKYKNYPGMIHGFFNYGGAIDEGILARQYLADSINSILKN